MKVYTVIPWPGQGISLSQLTCISFICTSNLSGITKILWNLPESTHQVVVLETSPLIWWLQAVPHCRPANWEEIQQPIPILLMHIGCLGHAALHFGWVDTPMVSQANSLYLKLKFYLDFMASWTYSFISDLSGKSFTPDLPFLSQPPTEFSPKRVLVPLFASKTCLVVSHLLHFPISYYSFLQRWTICRWPRTEVTFCNGQNAQSKCYTWEGLEFLNIFQFYEGERYFAFIVIPIFRSYFKFPCILWWENPCHWFWPITHRKFNEGLEP